LLKIAHAAGFTGKSAQIRELKARTRLVLAAHMSKKSCPDPVASTAAASKPDGDADVMRHQEATRSNLHAHDIPGKWNYIVPASD